MRTFLIRRLLTAIPLIIVVSFITKALLVMSPGNYLDNLRLNPTISRDYLASMERIYHLDSSNVFERYWYWLWPALRGDFGYSFTKTMPVWTLIGERVLNTLLLTGSALIFSWVLAIPLGAIAAVYRNRWPDKVIGLFSFFGLSIPSVFFSLLMVLFAAKTGLFPAGGIHNQPLWTSMTGWEKFTDTLWHLVLPMIVLGTIGMAQYVRQMRSEMIETLSQDYIRTARAKGLSHWRVVWKHAVGNAINPLVTLFGLSLSTLLSGALLTEFVFGWPGLGLLTFDALSAKDEPLVMASVVLLVVMLVLGSLIADLLLAAIDPRIRVE
ncbi:MAG TPA: ABC transporter permease [Blastocatellia bacterium]|jgi:peptide/nickel transport system permease protein|nr:ABC transporter permease [Blastocatellia bacterium]